MPTLTKLCFIVLATAVLQATAQPSRMKRQGFSWGDYDDNTNLVSSSTPRTRPQTPTTAAGSGGGTTTTTPSPTYTACVRRCALTPQYNPICGTNRVTYNNESHLKCAQNCGLTVERAFGGSCQPA